MLLRLAGVRAGTGLTLPAPVHVCDRGAGTLAIVQSTLLLKLRESNPGWAWVVLLRLTSPQGDSVQFRCSPQGGFASGEAGSLENFYTVIIPRGRHLNPPRDGDALCSSGTGHQSDPVRLLGPSSAGTAHWRGQQTVNLWVTVVVRIHLPAQHNSIWLGPVAQLAGGNALRTRTVSVRITPGLQLIVMSRKPRYSDDELITAVAECTSIAEVMRRLGIRPAGGSHYNISCRVRKMGLSTSHFRRSTGGRHMTKRRLKPEEILVLRERRGHVELIRRAMIEIGIPHKCAECGLGAEWMGRVLILEVDHINGNSFDDRPHNVRFLCPNCHSQQEHSNKPHKYRVQVAEAADAIGLNPIESDLV